MYLDQRFSVLFLHFVAPVANIPLAIGPHASRVLIAIVNRHMHKAEAGMRLRFVQCFAQGCWIVTAVDRLYATHGAGHLHIVDCNAVAGAKIDEVFIGSCMTNIGHFRAAGKLLEAANQVIPTRLWVAPPTKMDEHQLKQEGFYNIFASAGARTEMPGCSLCMGNQARVAPSSTVVSTSTRNFPNRLGQGADVYLASAELAAIVSILGKLPTVEEYQQYAETIDTMAPDIYQYLNFDQMPAFTEAAEKGRTMVEVELA